MSINWVMLTWDGKIVPKPGEKILHTSRTRVALDLTTPPELNLSDPFDLRSDEGIVYITNERVIYLPARSTESFKSFFAPILHFSDTHVQSSWIGPWSWHGVVKPVAGGGIPFNVPRVDAKLTFKDGGHHDFRTTFEWLKERHHHAADLELNPSANVEPPPPYEPAAGEAASSASSPAQQEPAQDAATQSDSAQGTAPVPDEPPPNYDAAQAQAVTMDLEEHLRAERERQ